MTTQLPVTLLFCATVIVSPGWAQTSGDAPYVPEYSKVYDPERDPVADGKDALKYAHDTGRRVLIEAGGDWCSYCRILDRFLGDNPAVRESLHERFVVLKVNVSDVNENEAFMSALPKTSGYPHFFIAENDGTIIFSDDTTHLFHDGGYSKEHFIEFLNEWGPQTAAEQH